MNNVKSVVAITAIASAVVGTQSAVGATMVDNLDPDHSSGYTILGENFPVEGYQVWEAVSFTTGAGSSWQIDTLTMALSDLSGESSEGLNPDGITFEIHANNAGVPASGSISTLTKTTDIFLDANIDFTPSSALILSPGTTYWVVGRPSDPDALYPWYTTTTAADNGVSGWSIGNETHFSIDQGGSWEANPDIVQIKIGATAVPESASLCMLSLGAMAMLRRTRASSKN
ncbi:MAG: hypothetical protein H7144_14030 [Burkholderiales bacterium]|nr:hypothetical protein [Phycisphaerae bacterium]